MQVVTLPLVDDDLASCVGCGLCLPHCPTFRVTGEERYSPRGRIAAIRQVHEPHESAPSELAAAFFGGDSFLDMMDTCVQCRGCETACPSGVPFGRLMEGARQGLVNAGGYQRWDRRLGYRMLGWHTLLLSGSRLLAVAQRSGLVPSARLGLPKRLPLRNTRLRVPPATQNPGVGADTGSLSVWLHTGCVMDAWQRPVHQATLNVLGAMGVSVRLARPSGGGGCCGALANHAGLADIARDQGRATMAAFPGDDPILVGSAGCGAQLKDLGHLLGDAESSRFAARVFDLNEWMAANLALLPAPKPGVGTVAGPVAVQDPCHLRHVQKVHGSVRQLLEGFVDLVELDDEGLCCGAGGAYSVLQPELSGAIRDRKLEAVAVSGAVLVASANPGCSMHLAAGGLEVRHPVELVAARLGLGPGTEDRGRTTRGEDRLPVSVLVSTALRAVRAAGGAVRARVGGRSKRG